MPTLIVAMLIIVTILVAALVASEYYYKYSLFILSIALAGIIWLVAFSLAPWQYYPEQTCEVVTHDDIQMIVYVDGDGERQVLNLNQEFGRIFKDKTIKIRQRKRKYYYGLSSIENYADAVEIVK